MEGRERKGLKKKKEKLFTLSSFKFCFLNKAPDILNSLVIHVCQQASFKENIFSEYNLEGKKASSYLCPALISLN